MRSVKFITVLGFVLLASLSLLFIGCGSDKTSPTSNAGSLTNPEFVAVQDQLESLVDSTLGFVLTGMNAIGTISSGGNVDPVLYAPGFGDTNQDPTYANGWHIVNLVQNTADFAYTVIDSVQFYANGDISQFGVASDSLRYRHHWNYDVVDKAVSFTTFAGDASFDFKGLNDSYAVITGSNDLVVDNQFVSVDSTVVRTFEFATDVNNLAINRGPSGWDHSCPNSGTVATTVTMTYIKNDGAAVTTTWNATMTFTDGSAAVSVRSGNVVWNYTSDVCIALN